jgi:hypothetical protein
LEIIISILDGIFEAYQLDYSPIGTQSTGFLPNALIIPAQQNQKMFFRKLIQR